MLRPAIVQDAASGRVLMLAWMNEESERLTRETGEAWFWSRSREQLWRKGETSGNTLAVVEFRDDCDGDALLLRVTPAGPTCHTGSVSCFAPSLWRTISERALERPAGSYTAELLEAGIGAVARKVGEEAVELTVAALDTLVQRGTLAPAVNGATIDVQQGAPQFLLFQSHCGCGGLPANALKYVAPGVIPRIRIESRRLDGAVEIQVTDNGVGIPERDAWFANMASAVKAGGLDPADEAEMLEYFAMAANHLINTPQ